MEGRTIPQYDVVRMLQNLKVEGLTLSQLLDISPKLRKLVADAFRNTDQEAKAAVLSHVPYLTAALFNPLDDYRSPTGDGVPEYELNLNACRMERGGFALSKSATRSHQIRMQVDDVEVTGMLDDGCCVIAMSGAFMRQHANRWSLAKGGVFYRLRMIDGDATTVVGEVHRLIGTVGKAQFEFGAVVLEGLPVPFVFGRPLLELLNGHADYSRALYGFNWKGYWIVVNAVGGDHHDVRELSEDEKKAWSLGQTPLYEFFRCTSAERRTPLRDLHVQPKQVTFAENEEVRVISDKEEEPLPRRVATIEGNALKVPVGGGVTLDFESTTPEGINEFVESGGAVEWLFDAHYPSDYPERIYSGLQRLQETGEEIERFCGALMALGVVEPTSDERNSLDDELWDLEPTDLRMITWNINGVRNILRNRELKGLLRKWDLDIVCVQELRVDAELMKKSVGEAVADVFEGYHGYLNLFTKMYSGVGVLVHKRLLERFGIPEVMRKLPEREGITSFDEEGRMIAIDFPNGGPVIVNVYCPNGMMGEERIRYKLEFHRRLELVLLEYYRDKRAVY